MGSSMPMPMMGSAVTTMTTVTAMAAVTMSAARSILLETKVSFMFTSLMYCAHIVGSRTGWHVRGSGVALGTEITVPVSLVAWGVHRRLMPMHR
jgi:hypothetical protein